MELDLKDGMCRCCASEGSYKDFTASYQWMGVEEVYSDMLKDCFDITLSTSNMNNGGICEVCITQLRNAFNFKKQVLNTEEQFKKLQENLLNSDIVKIEEVQADVDDTFEADDMDADFSGSEYDLPIKLIKKEKYEESKPKKRTRASTSKSKKNSEESGETSAKRKRPRVKIETDTDTVKTEKKQITRMNTKSKLLMNKHLHNVEEVLRCSNATPFRGYEGQGYRCCYCTQQCMKPGDLKAHTALTHEGIKKAYFGYAHIEKFNIKLDITDLHCTLCGSTIDNIEALVNHLINDHNKLIHTDIKSHIIPFKFDGGEGLRCFICSNRFNAFKALLEHMKLHIRNFVCQVCDAGFINRSQLRYHFQTHKTGTFKCDHCEKVFSTSLKCKSHMRSVHEKSVINKCGFCEATFVSYRHKQKHQLEEHGVDCQVKCEACGRSFQSQGSYRKHLRANHLMERRFECTFCDLKFFTVTGLNRHMVKHTGARDFKCDVCHKAFGRRNTLREHMRIHTDDRRFKCEYCGLAFVQKCSWRGHMRSRHGEEV